MTRYESLGALAERAITAPKWEWLLGMRAILRADGYALRLSFPADIPWIAEHRAVPDFMDGATIGSVAMLVRRVRLDGFLSARPCPSGGWEIHGKHGPVPVPTHADTEIGAWINLLEAS